MTAPARPIDIPTIVPDFFLVGAPKCATSSLHKLLRRHPGIFMSNPKEPHYFATDLPGLAMVPDAAAYAALFQDAPDGALLGEASAYYLSSTEAATNIKTANPDARIVISIRNPADAAFSMYHQLRDGFREDCTSFETAWELQQARARGERLPSYAPEPRQLQYKHTYSYHDQIARYFDIFGRDRVMVIVFEDLKADPDRVLGDLFGFLGVEATRDQFALPHTNVRRTPRFPWLNQIIASPPALLKPLVQPAKAILNGVGITPSEVMMKYTSRQVSGDDKPVLDPVFRARLTAAFDDDVAALERLLDRPLPRWRAG